MSAGIVSLWQVEIQDANNLDVMNCDCDSPGCYTCENCDKNCDCICYSTKDDE